MAESLSEEDVRKIISAYNLRKRIKRLEEEIKRLEAEKQELEEKFESIGILIE